MVKIDSTIFGEITIDGKVYYSDMTVWWDGKMEYRDKNHIIDTGEFLSIAKSKPEIIVIGTGQEGILKLGPGVSDLAEERNIEIYAEKTPKAIKMFNAFISDKKKAVCVVHVTC